MGGEAFMRGSCKYLWVPRLRRARLHQGKRDPHPGASEVDPVPTLTAEGLVALRALAEMGAAKDFVATSSGELAKRLGTSQQTASRRILELVEGGLVQRRMAQRRQLLRITPAGVQALREEYDALRAALEPAPSMVRIRGKVSTGLGEGGWYMARRGYQEGLKALLGFAPFPGTLNVSLDGSEAEKLSDLQAREGVLVPEFQDEGRSFGAVKAFPARIALSGSRSARAAAIDGGVVLPLRGHHRAVLEVIAPMRLREKLGIRDGDEVVVEVALA
jgi:riboflavin kinase